MAECWKCGCQIAPATLQRREVATGESNATRGFRLPVNIEHRELVALCPSCASAIDKKRKSDNESYRQAALRLVYIALPIAIILTAWMAYTLYK